MNKRLNNYGIAIFATTLMLVGCTDLGHEMADEPSDSETATANYSSDSGDSAGDSATAPEDTATELATETADTASSVADTITDIADTGSPQGDTVDTLTETADSESTDTATAVVDTGSVAVDTDTVTVADSATTNVDDTGSEVPDSGVDTVDTSSATEDSETEEVCISADRDCTSSDDINCNGVADNTEDACIVCVLEDTEPCDDHGALDGHGICTAGVRECLLADDGQSVGWSPCEGAQGPEPVDCTSELDNNCDGIVDSATPSCICEEGDVDTDCSSNNWPGAPSAVGICHSGVSNCNEDGVWSTCIDFQGPNAKNCESELDNDCNGIADNTEDDCTSCLLTHEESCDTTLLGICAEGTHICELKDGGTNVGWSTCEQTTAASTRNCNSMNDNNCNGIPDNQEAQCQCDGEDIGASEACGSFPQYWGIGACQAGSRDCEIQPGSMTAAWGTCTGEVTPSSRNCALSSDNNCDGNADNQESACMCDGEPAGTSQDCGSYSSFWGQGICVAGTRTCTVQTGNSTADWSSCTGEIAPGTRDCTSSLDNDCNGIADNQESICQCNGYSVDGTRECGDYPLYWETGQCSAGSQICEVQPGGSTVAWSTCINEVGPAARNCNSANDYNCDGAADNTESECQCNGLAIGEARNCGDYSQFWGIGECHAGQQTCLIQTGNDSAAWGTCSGEVWPTTEACGPTAPDADCDGIPGYNNGSCTDTIYITGYDEDGTNPFNWCMDFDGTGGQTDLDAIDDDIDIFAGTSVPAGHGILATIKVFRQQHAGTVPIIRCRFGQNTNVYTYFVDFSETGECYEESQTPDEDPVGYVSTVAAEGYRRLRYLNLYSNRYPGTDMFAGTVPMGYSNCPNNCLCLDSNYYAVP